MSLNLVDWKDEIMNVEHLGLSKKTNVAMTSAGCFAAVGSVGSAVDWRIGMAAIVAACLVALVAMTYQFIVDYWKK